MQPAAADTSDYWLSLARHTPLGLLSDLDGTLLPFANTPPRPTPELSALLTELASLEGMKLVIVSGRPRDTLEESFPTGDAVTLVAEHGAWRREGGRWEPMLTVGAHTVDTLAEEIARLQGKHPALRVERKTWSVTLHFRQVPPHAKAGVVVEAAAAVGHWLETHPDFERLWGVEALEVRHREARKSNAVRWVKSLLGPSGRLIVVGDDVTDEDMFVATSGDDATVLVGSELEGATSARFRLVSSDNVQTFYRWILSVRRQASAAATSLPTDSPQVKPQAGNYRLLMISNRLPELRSAESPLSARKRNVGGLVSALAPVLAGRGGVWLGWSGRTRGDAKPTDFGLDSEGPPPALAWVDFPEDLQKHYYNGLSNSALWPLFHSFQSKVKFSHRDWAAYVRANESFSEVATKLVGPDATVWAHDYHLLLLGKALRDRGHRGRIGLFQHVPFPGPDLFFLLPWANEVLSAMLAFDLVGFHTRSYAENFLRCVAELPGARVEGNAVFHGGHRTKVGAFPIGIVPEDFQRGEEPETQDEIQGLIRTIGANRMVLGVDRLDYTKGIPERIEAFGQMLVLFPEWRRKVSLVQVSVPSRADIAEYAEQRSRVENTVGRLNGELGEADWVPIRYLYRAYTRSQLSRLYRAASVGYVTPLRDGMNLVAKEYVAAQDPESPGVLLLSRFAGAAEELHDALITNPWDSEGTARDLDRALRMPLEERKTRHAALLAAISKTTALTWAEAFLTALAE